MSIHVDDLVERFRKTCGELSDGERQVVNKLKRRRLVSRDTNRQFDGNLTFGERIADQIAMFVGSWPFILLFLLFLFLWIVLNTFILARIGKAFDLYPYILLNLMLSMIAALQAPLIMMSQNRQAAKDRLDAEHDYEVNLKAELEILALHQKLDTLREDQWKDLVAMQQEQILLLIQLTQSNASERDAP